jgi:hypothetical protein
MQAKIGSRGDLVKEIQAKLVDLEFNPGPIDGVFGEKTLKAVAAFQESKDLEVDGIVGPITLEALGIKIEIKPTEIPEKERTQFKQLIMSQPNYFGTLSDATDAAVVSMQCNKKYEEIKCIGFYPERDLLYAIIDIKLPYGYKGNLCSPGSFEYVRFYIDWNDDGDFVDADEDVGIADVNVHNIPNGNRVCRDKDKPLSYAVGVKIDPKKYHCKIANLVKVRAILSWDVPPPPGDPDYPPVWGNVMEKWIQIEPTDLVLAEVADAAKLKELGFDPELVNLNAPISMAKALSTDELKAIYDDQDVPAYRYNFKHYAMLVKQVEQNPYLMEQFSSEVAANVEVLTAQNASTKYEQLRCVGLEYDSDTLVATMTVKLPSGYSGGLCYDGSYEYVAFWIRYWDQIEQMCVWKYLGTASVNVHDIPEIPPEGLQYAVKLPVDLSDFKDVCNNPKVYKLRAILSWRDPPPTYDPNHDPKWGNKLDRLIQIRSTKTPMPGQQIPFIDFVGGMAVCKISGNSETSIPSAIGDGYANGANAVESPFGGVISICGHISNPPNGPIDPNKLRYKVQYRKLTELAWHDIQNKFKIYIDEFDGITWSQYDKMQVAIGGYYEYEEDLEAPIQKFIAGSDYGGGSVLADWHTPVPEGDGLYEVRVLLYKLGAPGAFDVPPNHVSSNVIKVMVDNKVPDAEVSLDTGPCQTFNPSDIISGTFEAKDEHFWKYRLILLPYGPDVNGNFEHHPLPGFDYVYGQIPAYPALPTASGVTSGTFELDTDNMPPCGYVVYLRVWDRTIRNNHLIGNQNHDSVGFCLLVGES